MEGPFAVLRPDVAEKLELGEEQVAQIQEIQNESNQARRQAMAAGRKIFAGFRKNQQGNNNQPAANPADPNAPAGQAQNGNNAGQRRRAMATATAAGGMAGGGNGTRRSAAEPGRQGGPGGRGNFDPEAMRKYMEQPEVKAKMEEMRKQQDQIRDQSYAQVYKVLDRRQSSPSRRCSASPSTSTRSRTGFFRGPGQRGPGGGAARPAAKTDTRQGG